jgi:hypothetical protein
MLWLITSILLAASAPTTRPAVGRLPHIAVDAKHRQIRVECQAVQAQMPLEFLCCVHGSHDYESVLSSRAKPSDLHLALLMLGLTPGAPAHRSKDLTKWYPPHGPALKISVEFTQAGQTVRMPAWRLLRNVNTKKPAPPMTWIFAGSQFTEDGRYVADAMGYLVSLVNFSSTLIDVPYVASNSNQTLQWEYNPQTLPPPGTPVTMLIEPIQSPATRPATRPATQP